MTNDGPLTLSARITDRALNTLAYDQEWGMVNWRLIPADVVDQANHGLPVRRPTPEEFRSLCIVSTDGRKCSQEN